MAELTAELVVDVRADVGEGPLWDAERRCLWWVDMLVGDLHRVEASGAAGPSLSLGRAVGFLVPLAGGGLVAGIGDEVGRLDPEDGGFEPVVRLEAARPGYRVNDARCDPRGRLWVGTLTDETYEDGSVYRIGADWEVTTFRTGIDMPNGMGWSADGRTMYLADSGTRDVEVWDYDLEAGEPTRVRSRIAIPAEMGIPDGLTVDAEDCVWVAVWGAGRVRRHAPDGELLSEVALPTRAVASCAFGGEDLGDLYITTGTHLMTPEELAREPLSGSVFRCRPEVGGVPPDAFAP